MSDCGATNPEPNPYRVVVVDDHPLLLIGLKYSFEQAGLSVTVGPVLPTGELIDWITSQWPDCAVLDLNLPNDGGGLALIRPLVARGINVVILTGETSSALWAACINEGAAAVASKAEPLDEVVELARQVCAGRAVRVSQRATLAREGQRLTQERSQQLAPFRSLSRREQEVLAALMDGLGPAEIAERDFVSVQTIRTQVKALLRKLSARSQLEAVAKARSAGWVAEVPSYQL